MATDIKREGLNNQKRGICVMVSDLIGEADLGAAGSTIATLPDNSTIISASLLNLVVSGTAGDNLALDYNGSAIEADIDVQTLGIIPGTVVGTAAHSDTGGDVVVKDGTQMTGTAWSGYVIVEYIELDKVTGEYTN
jgi:hypothetical protein